MTENAKNYAARLMAVQALYQASQNKASAPRIAQDYLAQRADMDDAEEAETAPCNADLFQKIVSGGLSQGKELEVLVNQYYTNENKAIEPLLKAILLCGAYEIQSHRDIDFPIIINDYLDITHSFYGRGEVSLVNGILDKLREARV